MIKENKKLIARTKAPFVSMGFRISITDELCIVDFIDRPSEDLRRVESSVALTKKQAKQLVESLQQFITED